LKLVNSKALLGEEGNR